MSAERVERRLAAILAADVAGYSRIMGQDEVGTLSRLRNHRREFIDPKIAEHKGRIVKTTGDGILVEFSSVVEAVACAVVIQRGMAERNTTTPETQRIEFRIGIHQGTSSSRTAISSAMASTSRRDLKALLNRVPFVSRRGSRRMPPAGSTLPSRIWAISPSRTSRGRFGSTRYERKAWPVQGRPMCR